MSDLFELPPSTPPRLVTLRAEFAAAQEALDQASANEDETGEPIPARLHHNLRHAEHRLLIEEARVAHETATNAITATALKP